MADFTAKDVQALRQSTGAGMMDAKKALVENDGDAEAAAQWLREKGIAKSASRSDRENSEGVVVARVDGQTAAVVELKCETDFVAKSDQFGDLAERILVLSLIHISEPTRQEAISYAVFCLKKISNYYRNLSSSINKVESNTQQ